MVSCGKKVRFEICSFLYWNLNTWGGVDGYAIKFWSDQIWSLWFGTREQITLSAKQITDVWEKKILPMLTISEVLFNFINYF